MAGLPFLRFAIAALAVIMAATWLGVLLTVTHRTRVVAGVGVVLVALMSLQYGLAANGVLHAWDRRPPPFFLLIAGTVALTLWLGFSRFGGLAAQDASMGLLIGIQMFRLPLELVMHRAATDGVMPMQMSYSGYNFDIWTGISAVLLAILAAAGKLPDRAARIWNICGSCLLLNVVIIAIASTPVFGLFGPDRLNTWVADPPFVWLPGVLVPAALLGHVLLWRKLGIKV